MAHRMTLTRLVLANGKSKPSPIDATLGGQPEVEQVFALIDRSIHINVKATLESCRNIHGTLL